MQPPDIDCERAYLLVDDILDQRVLRTEEGLIVDVYRNETNDCLATMTIENLSARGIVMPNINCLEDIKCPVCDQEHRFFILSTVTARVTDTWLVNQGKVAPKTVHGILRHSDIRTTMRR